MSNGSPNRVDTSRDQIHRVEKSDVGRQARSGAAWSVVQIVLRNVLSVGTTAILARLLLPDDYGLMGMVATLTVLLLVFSDMGLSWATIQRPSLTQIQVSNLFWLNAATGALLWMACVLVAPLVAKFYGRPELVAVTIAMGASFLVSGIAVQPFALLKRSMRFRVLAEIEIAAVVVAAASGIAVALAGWGYWALVVQALIGQLVRLLLALPRSHMALHRPQSGVGTRHLVGFGGLLAVNGLLLYLARNLDNVLIGKVWGTEQLGYYDRAYFLMLLPSMLATGVLTNLMVPSLAALQDDKLRFGGAYRRAVRLVAYVGCPLAAGLALTAHEAVQLVYGERWLAVVPMLMWLSIAGITQPIYNTTGWLFTATGKAKPYLALTVFNAVVLVATFLWFVRRGATAVAMGYGLVMGLVLLVPALWLAHRSAGLRLRETAFALLPILAGVFAMMAAVMLTGWAADAMGLGQAMSAAAKVAIGLAVYAAASLTIMNPMLREDVFPMLPWGLVRRLHLDKV